MSGTVADLLAWAMALLLLAGAAGKLWERGEFALAVEAYELVPERAVGAFALGFPLLELSAGLLLLPAATRPWGVGLALLVLTAASAAILINLRRGRRVLDCGCGGLSGRQPISGWLLRINKHSPQKMGDNADQSADELRALAALEQLALTAVVGEDRKSVV